MPFDPRDVKQHLRGMSPLAKRMIIMLAIAAVVLFIIFGFEAFRSIMIGKAMRAFANPPQTVSTVVATTQEWQPTLTAVGSLRAVNGAELSLEVAGVVDKLYFQSGNDVSAGTVLMTLRSDDDVAKLHALQATADLDAINLARDEKQLKVNAVSKAQVDTDSATLRNAQAQVAEQQAIVDKKTLRAPFAGHLGIRAIDVGQYLAAGTNIVTLQALDPIYVDFTLPQQALAEVREGQLVTATVDTYADQSFVGKITAINPVVDVATRNVQVRASLANPDHLLLPGMYAKVTIDIGSEERYVTLPQTAIIYNPYGNTVYVVQDKGKDAQGHPQLDAQQAFVTTGPTRGDQVAILKGVDAGTTVVSAGQMKLRNGSRLIINNSVVPADNPNPHPQEE
ncbi:MAG TPA: efflux RND transporter periplasmic adaptor subunit [Stellaceae bacterium]|nr:efflux RND transporter periplasmic adaptor subunit [Stellaceae bacterium]